MTTPKNKKIIKEYPSTVTEKKENFTKDYLLKDSFHSNQLFSYKAIKNLKNGNKSSNTCDESQLRMLTKPPIVPNTKTAKFNAKTMEFKSYFKTHMDSTKIKKESPDQSFFLNVNELSFTEINPKKKIEEKNEKCFTLQQNNSANKNSAKFLYLKIDKKNEESKGYQTPQSKNRLYTVEEVFSISNDSSSINETNCFKFSNTNSAKKANNSLICRNSRCEKNRNVNIFRLLYFKQIFYFEIDF